MLTAFALLQGQLESETAARTQSQSHERQAREALAAATSELLAARLELATSEATRAQHRAANAAELARIHAELSHTRSAVDETGATAAAVEAAMASVRAALEYAQGDAADVRAQMYALEVECARGSAQLAQVHGESEKLLERARVAEAAYAEAAAGNDPPLLVGVSGMSGSLLRGSNIVNRNEFQLSLEY